MELSVKSQGETAKVGIVGSIDERGAEELKRRFAEIDAAKVKDVIFDFAGVTFIGSAGIGKLLLFYRNIASHGGKVTIENMSKDIHTMFKVVKLDKIFNITASK